MAAVNAADYSIATNGDIRYTGTTTNNTVIEFHRWLGDLMDNAVATGNDLLDITDATASERSTDNIITLKAPFNIDDTLAQHLYDGSIIQKNGDEIYDGLLVFSAANTPLQILQNGKPAYPNFWGTGINADSTNGISHRFMLKVRTGAADIDGRRIVGQTRDVGKTYSEFKINGTARGNNVLALTYATDLNNATAEATIRGWTTITNTEGYQLIDVNNDGSTEPYYSQWTRAALTINQFYERHKWLTRESTIQDSDTADSGTDFQVANATVIGQSQSFANGVNAQYLTRVRAKMKKVGSPTGNLTAKLYAHSGVFGTSSIPTGAALATSVNFDVATLTTAYVEYEIAFTTYYEMAASTNFCISFEHAVIDASNYVSVQGLATSGTHAGNRAQLVGVTWSATAGDDLYFKVYTSPKQYGIPGEVFRGITHEIPVGLAAQVGTFSAVEALSWTGGTGQLFATNSVSAARQMWLQLLTGVAPSAALVITGGTSGATATTNANTIATTALSGTGSVITITFAVQTVLPYPAGTTFTVAGCTPAAYNGTYVSTGGTTTTATAAGTATGVQTVAGTIVGVIVERSLSQPAVGASTGSAIIGAYGLGIATASLSASDKLTDLTNTLRVPPNNVTFTVSGLVSGASGDRVLVAPLGYEFAYKNRAGGSFALGDTLTFATPAGTGYLSSIRNDASGTTGRLVIRLLSGSVPTDNTSITDGAVTAAVNGTVVAFEDVRQLKLATTLNGITTTVSCTATIPTDTPTTGTIRIQMNTGIFRNISYTSYSGSNFTIGSTDFTSDPATGGAGEAGNSVFIAYIDKQATSASESFTGVYSADRSLFIRVRNGTTTPIKTFETTGTLGSAGGSSTAIRTSDT